MSFSHLNRKNNSFLYHTHTASRLTIKQKQAQSALEYMMTYGWAILIIVIVAVILYSMGIFNPSSSLTATSTGFSPFIVSSAVCSSGGLSLAVQTGPLPNLATSVTLNKVYVISSSGTNSPNHGYNISPVTLTPGHSAVLRLPIVCSSPGIKFSLSSHLQYSYSTPAGNVIINATGTVTGTSSSSNKIADFSNGGVMAYNPKPNNWTDGYTFSAWVEYPGRDFCGYALGLENWSTLPRGGIVLQCSAANTPYAETINSTSNVGSGVAPTALNNFTWYFLTGIYNPNTKNISLFINGNLITSATDSITPSSFTPTGSSYHYVMGGTSGVGFYGNISNAHVDIKL